MEKGRSASTYAQFIAENKAGVDLPAGTAVMLHASGVGVIKWTGARQFVGLVKMPITAATSGPIQISGPFRLSDWTTVTGAATLSNARYYASYATPGNLTTTASTVVGEIVQQVGVSISSDTLEIQPGPSVLL